MQQQMTVVNLSTGTKDSRGKSETLLHTAIAGWDYQWHTTASHLMIAACLPWGL